jgi:predicted PP-loop superfamily ATPase
VATLKEFEEALREQGMRQALRILERLRERDRKARASAAPRRVTATRMTPEIAREVLRLHRTTKMTQQEIAFSLGVNQGRVNEVIKHGKWLSDEVDAPKAPAPRAARRASASGGARRTPPASSQLPLF